MKTLSPEIEEVLKDWPSTTIPNDNSCLWHRQHEFYMERIVPLLPKCNICKGEVQDGGKIHEICRLRKQHALPTPRVSQVSECPCAKCNPKLRF